MDVSEAKRLRSLEDENRRLKQLVADLSLDKQALQFIVEKRTLVVVAKDGFGFSERRTCNLISASRTMIRYKPKSKSDDEKITSQIREITELHPRFGYSRVHEMILRRGYEINHKRTQRLCPIDNEKNIEFLG